jgi:serine/threonine-protein kinase
MIDLMPGTLLNNTYTVIKLLGKGGMGTVYLVEEMGRPQNRYAIKELIANLNDPEQEQIALQTFQTEIAFLGQLNHPQLPRFYGTFTHWNRNYLIMEFVEGESLESIIQNKKGPLPVDDVIYWGIEITKALDYLHTQSSGPIVYRDLKPANIIISPAGSARIVDFGIARRYDPSKITDTLRFGTPGYAAPEQFKAARLGQSTPKSDIYALGVILFQLLTGYDPTVTPFHFPPARHLNPQITPELERIINKAIQKKADDRYVDRRERDISALIRQDVPPLKLSTKAITAIGMSIFTFVAISGLTFLSTISAFGQLFAEHIPIIILVGLIPALVILLAVLFSDFKFY